MEPRDATRPPCVLLVEDDAITQTYLRAVVEALPAQVDTATTRTQALQQAARRRHDLWLIDLTLPDGNGAQLLQELRGHCGDAPPALAHTADRDPAVRGAALAAGFRDVLVKPMSTAELSNALRAALAESMDLPDWDNAAASAALNHNPGNVQALRRLFLDELPEARAEVLRSARSGDLATLRARLHRLQASCGLVGARRLGAAVESLRARPDCSDALEHFDRAARDLTG